MGNLMTEDKEMAALTEHFLCFIFTARIGPWESQYLELREKSGKTKTSLNWGWFAQRPVKLDTHTNPLGLSKMHSQVLREQVKVIAKPLFIICKRSWRTGEVPQGWSKANVILGFTKGRIEWQVLDRLLSLGKLQIFISERGVLILPCKMCWYIELSVQCLYLISFWNFSSTWQSLDNFMQNEWPIYSQKSISNDGTYRVWFSYFLALEDKLIKAKHCSTF